MSDLVITEFDQWTNPRDSMLSGTTICWYSEDDADVAGAAHDAGDAFLRDDFLESAA